MNNQDEAFLGTEEQFQTLQSFRDMENDLSAYASSEGGLTRDEIALFIYARKNATN